MAKSLILHIGWRKAGSTALQKFVFDNTRADRLQHLGIVPAGRVAQERVLGARVVAHHGLGGLARRRRCDQAWRDASSFFARRDLESFFVTSEVISSHLVRGGGHFCRLAEYVSSFDRVRVLCWLRRQDQYTASLAVQAAKHGGTGRERGDPEPLNWPRDADYADVLERLAAILPRAEILPLVYRGPGHDVVGEAIRLLGLDSKHLTAPDPGRINSRVSPEMYRVQIEVNRRAKARGMNTGKMQLLLLEAAASLPGAGNATHAAVPFTHAHRQRILERCLESNRRLCARYGLDIAHFAPSAAELGKTPDFNIPDRVPKGYVAMLVEKLEGNRTDCSGPETDFIRACLDEVGDRG